MGRRNIEIKKIEDEISREVTFLKSRCSRRHPNSATTHTTQSRAILVFSPAGHPYIFSSSKGLLDLSLSRNCIDQDLSALLTLPPVPTEQASGAEKDEEDDWPQYLNFQVQVFLIQNSSFHRPDGGLSSVIKLQFTAGSLVGLVTSSHTSTTPEKGKQLRREEYESA